MKENKLVDLSFEFAVNPILSASQKYWVAAVKGKNGNHNALIFSGQSSIIQLDKLEFDKEVIPMKKIISIVLALVCVLGLVACGGNVKNVKITDYSSEIYTNAEIESAIAVAIDYFKKNFEGCTLTEITYLGDDKNEDWKEFAGRNNATDVIVLVSSFDVGASGGDGSLNPNSTYTNWKWVLVRTNGGKWEHVDHGY